MYFFNYFPGAITVGIQRSTSDTAGQSSTSSSLPGPLQSHQSETSSIPPRPVKKSRMKTTAESDETRDLSTTELQRLVLLEQLKLIRMQQQQITNSQK